MQRTFKPANFPDPFPAPLGTPATCIYSSDLALIRFKEAIQTGAGRDALYITQRPYFIQYTLDDSDEVYGLTVPAGMLTDLASVPWFARWLVGRVGRHLEAAIVHDFLYVARHWEDDEVERADKRRFADELMQVAMRDAGVNGFAAWLIFMSVRLMGGILSRPATGTEFLDLRDPEVAARLHGDETFTV